jgi:hypothetical protein
MLELRAKSLNDNQKAALRSIVETGYFGHARTVTRIALLERKLVTTRYIAPELFTEEHKGDPDWIVTEAGRKVYGKLFLNEATLRAEDYDRVNRRDEILALAASMEITLDGKRAKLGDSSQPHAQVWQVGADGGRGEGAEFEWSLAADVVRNRGGAFDSSLHDRTELRPCLTCNEEGGVRGADLCCCWCGGDGWTTKTLRGTQDEMRRKGTKPKQGY